MNERRHEYQSQLRKAKKSHLVTLKRRYNATSVGDVNMPAMSLQEVCKTYIRQRDMQSLEALQSALAASDTAVLQLSDEAAMQQLANTLAYSLRNDASLQERLLASRVLTNLAAMNAANSSTNASYYEKQPQGWCQVLIQSHALPALAHALSTFATEVDPT